MPYEFVHQISRMFSKWKSFTHEDKFPWPSVLADYVCGKGPWLTEVEELLCLVIVNNKQLVLARIKLTKCWVTGIDCNFHTSSNLELHNDIAPIAQITPYLIKRYAYNEAMPVFYLQCKFLYVIPGHSSMVTILFIEHRIRNSKDLWPTLNNSLIQQVSHKYAIDCLETYYGTLSSPCYN